MNDAYEAETDRLRAAVASHGGKARAIPLARLAQHLLLPRDPQGTPNSLDGAIAALTEAVGLAPPGGFRARTGFQLGWLTAWRYAAAGAETDRTAAISLLGEPSARQHLGPVLRDAADLFRALLIVQGAWMSLGGAGHAAELDLAHRLARGVLDGGPRVRQLTALAEATQRIIDAQRGLGVPTDLFRAGGELRELVVELRAVIGREARHPLVVTMPQSAERAASRPAPGSVAPPSAHALRPGALLRLAALGEPSTGLAAEIPPVSVVDGLLGLAAPAAEAPDAEPVDHALLGVGLALRFLFHGEGWADPETALAEADRALASLESAGPGLADAPPPVQRWAEATRKLLESL